MPKFILCDTEVALWAVVGPDGQCDPSQLTPELAHVRLIQYAINGENPTIIDLYTPEGTRQLLWLQGWLEENPDARWVFHNAGFDIPKLAKLGLHIKTWDCTQTMSQIVYAGLGFRHHLDDVVERETGETPYDKIPMGDIPEGMRAKKMLQNSDWSRNELTPEQLKYALTDVGPEYRDTYLSLWQKVTRPWFWRSYELELETQPIVWEMVANGFRFNLPKWKAYIAEKEADLNKVEDRLIEILDRETQERFPERFMITLRRKKPREGKPARYRKDGGLIRPEVPAQVVGDLASVQPTPALSPIRTLHDSLRQREVGDYRVGYIIREELGLPKGPCFNITSAQQMRELMNEILGLDQKETTFNDAVITDLKKVAQETNNTLALEILELHLEAQALRKLTSTYGESYWRYADAEGYVRARVQTTATDTARWSTSEPNTQNMPREMQEMLFCCEEDEVMVKVDASAQEARLVLYVSGEYGMYDKLSNGLDLHSVSASIYLNKPYEELITRDGGRDKVKPEFSEARSHGKKFTFAIPYGCSATKLSEILNCPKEKAQGIIDGYWAGYPNLKAFQDSQWATVRDNLYLTDRTFGRMRFFRITSEDQAALDAGQKWERVIGRYKAIAYNYAIQSTGATMLRFTLRNLAPWLKEHQETGAKLRMCIHDSVIVTCKKEYAKEVADACRAAMELGARQVCPGISIPADVDILEKGYPSFANKEPMAA